MTGLTSSSSFTIIPVRNKFRKFLIRIGLSLSYASGIIVLTVTPLVGGALVWGLACMFRWRFPRMALPIAFASSHTALLLLAVALFPTDIFIPNIPFDDLYTAYFFIPGTHIWLIGQSISNASLSFLFARMSSHWASITGIVFIPGFVGMVLGGLQWYAMGNVVQRFTRHIPDGHPDQDVSGAT
jgi:hypothetical protein